MARFTLFVAFAVGFVSLLDHARAVPLSSGASEIGSAPQIPNFPGPGEIPKPPGMLHSRRARRDVRDLIDAGNSVPSFETIRSSWHNTGCRGKRDAKGTGGKLPRKSG
uniref:Uncharacterized protein n=1 Tax=Anopheles atroparvus TaxID=41427 RepID=A0A182J3I5_ANOAO